MLCLFRDVIDCLFTAGLIEPRGECREGFFCISGAATPTPTDGVTGDECSMGGYCLAGSSQPSPCPPGSYNPSRGLVAQSECQPCLGGQYCEGFGNERPDGNCSASYYCTQNATVPNPTDGTTGDICPVNHYCTEGSAAPIECEPGSYADSNGLEFCTLCTPGRYCLPGFPQQSCPLGYYCPEGTGYVWQACPVGTYGEFVGLISAENCTQCDGGFYCDIMNSSVVAGPCLQGYFCTEGADSPTPTGLGTGVAGPCPEGHYCAAQTIHPAPCPAGTFSNDTMLTLESQCQDCLPGMFCEVPGSGYPTGPCDAGYYCVSGANASNPSEHSATGGPCPAGEHRQTPSSNYMLKCTV